MKKISLLILVVIFLSACDGNKNKEEKYTINLYFIDTAKHDNGDCAATLITTRIIENDKVTEDTVIRLLLKGVSKEEEKRGLSDSFLPAPYFQTGTKPLIDYYKGITITDDTAIINFEKESLPYLNGPACNQFSVKSPIEKTLLELPHVRKVEYAIDGEIIEGWDA